MAKQGIHEEVEYINGNGDAIVFIHGILGSPGQFRFLADELFKKGFDCISLLLPGHGGTAKMFYQTPCGKWAEYVKQRIDEVAKKYKRVVLVGHSLGGLLCLDYAASSAVAGIVLINTPLAFKISPKQLAISMKILFSCADSDDELHSVYRAAFSVSNGRIYEYPLWLRQFIGLVFIMQRSRKRLKNVRAATLIIQSAKDESVYRRSAALLSASLVNTHSQLLYLEHSYHGYFPPDDRKTLVEAIIKFMSSEAVK